MSWRSCVAIVVCLGLATAVVAEDPVVPASRPVAGLPPLALPSGFDRIALPPGQPVSRPLQSIEVEPTAVAPDARVETLPPTLESLDRMEMMHPLGRSWTVLEYLVWWPSCQPLPPLVTSSRGARPPILGGPQTHLLLGNSSLADPEISGARLAHSFTVNEARTAGIEVAYFFLGSRTVSATISEFGATRPRFLGRPIIDAITGEEDVVPVSIPGASVGAVDVSLSTRLTGWEITRVANLYSGPWARVNALAGYRYFMVNEGLRIEQVTLFPNSPAGPSVLVAAADQFDAHNRFHGAQLGLSADWARGPVFVEAIGKVGLGRAVNVVRVSGQSVAVAAGMTTPVVEWFDGGVLGQATNAGRFERGGFAVLPEAGVKIGYRFQDRSRFYIGYNFIYLSEAVRPGDQIDLTVDQSQVPLLGRGDAVFAERPAPVLARSDFWVQGLVFGLEYRY